MVTTKPRSEGPDHKGGISNYRKVKNEILLLLKDTNAARVTTMIDLYHLPSDFPGQASIGHHWLGRRKAEHLQQHLETDIGEDRFVAYMQSHEFEALLFAEPTAIVHAFPDERNLAAQLQMIDDLFDDPEEIDDEDPPSKRLIRIIGSYNKELHGALIAQEISMENMIARCHGFRNWIKRLVG